LFACLEAIAIKPSWRSSADWVGDTKGPSAASANQALPMDTNFFFGLLATH
jgi:hypothetical protein